MTDPQARHKSGHLQQSDPPPVLPKSGRLHPIRVQMRASGQGSSGWILVDAGSLKGDAQISLRNLVATENKWLHAHGYTWRWRWEVSAGGHGTREGDLFVQKVPVA